MSRSLDNVEGDFELPQERTGSLNVLDGEVAQRGEAAPEIRPRYFRKPSTLRNYNTLLLPTLRADY